MSHARSHSIIISPAENVFGQLLSVPAGRFAVQCTCGWSAKGNADTVIIAEQWGSRHSAATRITE